MRERAIEETLWRGMRIAHPADWELATVAPPDGPERCVFTGRRAGQLEVRWRSLATEPNLDLLLETYNHADGAESAARQVALEPPAWRGLVREVEGDHVVHAGRYFEESHWLVEVVISWSGARDADLESSILESTGPCASQDGAVTWQAMGIRMTAPSEFELRDCSAIVGRVRWDFAPGGRRAAALTVERLAMPAYWLNGSLAKWLEGELPQGFEQVRKHQTRVNGHPAHVLNSRTRRNPAALLRLDSRVRVDLAWHCPVEERVYRLGLVRPSGDGEARWPESVQVTCCRPAPVVAIARNLRPGASAAAAGLPRSVGDLLGAVPLVNRSMNTVPAENGGALVSVPMKRPRYMVPPLSWVLPFSSHRKIRLDRMGVRVLDMCRREQPIEEMIESVAGEHKLSFREAELAVMSFVRMLTERGVVAVAGDRT